MEMIRMEDVSLSLGGTPVLKQLSFSVEAGEIFGFLGPSGAGKTTTIKALTRQLRPGAGRIAVLGKPLDAFQPADYEQIGIMTDNSGVYERLTAEENLALFARMQGLPAQRAVQALRAVGLQDAARKPAQKLSRGMRQRLVLARALLPRPQLLFLDEPTGALDPATAQAIHGLIRSARDAGATVFLTTHNMQEAQDLCDRVAFLDGGEIRELAAPAALRLKYARNEVCVTTRDGRSFSCEKTPAALAALLARLDGAALAAIHSQEPTLRDIFLQVTGRELV